MLGKTSRKHAYLNILKISPPKAESFSDKNSDIFHISAQNADCGSRKNGIELPVLMSTHNVCFEQKYEKYCIPL